MKRAAKLQSNRFVLKQKGDDDIYTLEIHPKGYTKAQITQAFDRGEAYLRKHLVAKNKSLNEVERNLEMPVKIPGENIAVTMAE